MLSIIFIVILLYIRKKKKVECYVNGRGINTLEINYQRSNIGIVIVYMCFVCFVKKYMIFLIKSNNIMIIESITLVC